ncbi:zinc finger protein 419-like [Gigantopelta aegis]|uniref:zinc finger protein 419-like n=1 Tax=Gigantopelta aegis TaxID=1735272 RepID=UPI001B887702|nr:zinc finger protein 419-like [Gigantopelta aegis]
MLKTNEHVSDPVKTETAHCSAVLKTTGECVNSSTTEYTKDFNRPLCMKLNSPGTNGNISYVANTPKYSDSCNYGGNENGNETKSNTSVKHDNSSVSDFLRNDMLNNVKKESDNHLAHAKTEMSVSTKVKQNEKAPTGQIGNKQSATEFDESDSGVSENSNNQTPVSCELVEGIETCTYRVTINEFDAEYHESNFNNSEHSDQTPSKKYCLRKTRKLKDGDTKIRKTETKNQIKSSKVKIWNRPTGLEGETNTPDSKNKSIKKRKRKGKTQSEKKCCDLPNGPQEDDNKKRYQCHICGKLLKSSSAVNVHQRVHTGEKPFSCTVCNKSFSVKESLNRHLRTHTGEKPYVCSFCGESFGQAASLKRHLGRHTGNYPFKCHMCDKRYIQHSDLIGHLRSHEGLKREKLWTCEVCGSGFVSTRNLIRHVKWVHIADKPFVCDICGKGFVELGKLSAHQRYHTGERPFKCTICDRGFVDKSYLREHVKLHEDKGKKTFKCRMCDKDFSSSKSLYRHVRTIHTKEEVYTCNICWKSFGQSGNLKIHRLRHHKAEYIKPGSKFLDDFDEEEDIYEQYVIQQNKIFIEKSSQVDSCSVSCRLESSTSENHNLKTFTNITREDILKKFARPKSQTSSAESIGSVFVVREDDKKLCLNDDGKFDDKELKELDGDEVKSLKDTADDSN